MLPGFRGRAAAAAIVTLALADGLPAAAADFRLLELDDAHVKWGAPAYGTGAEVTWGFATGAERFSDAMNCGTLVPMGALGRMGGDPARLAAIVEAAFAMWSRAADVRFRPAPAGEAPDILIGAQGEPERIAFANVWHARADGGIAPLTRATICFNPRVAWSTTAETPADGYDFATVLAHEIGHAIGLDHPGPTGALMAYSNQGDLDALMPGDVAGVVRLYGPTGTANVRQGK